MSVNEKMTALADAIREKSGVTGKLTIDGMTSAVKAISSLIVASASGNPIVLNDSTDLRVQSLRLFGKTTQNGTPTPAAPVPLVSAGDGGSLGVTVAGKNLLNQEYCAITSTKNQWGSMMYLRQEFVLLPGVTYTLSFDTENTGLSAYFNKTFSKTEKKFVMDGARKFHTFTYDTKTVIPYGAAVVSRDAATSEVASGLVSNIQLEINSVATGYESYKEQALTFSTPNGLPGITVTSGGNYTDETGQQWVCDEVDFGRGIYVQRIFGTVFKSAVGWNLAGTKNGLKRFYTNQFMGVIKNAKDDATKECALCSHFINVTASDTWNEVTGISVNSKGRLDIYYSGIEQTTAALEVYFSSNPVAFMAELATPIETPLSTEELAAYAALHTNYPNTTILNDGGAGMEVKYVADTKNYIDNQIAAVAAAIVNA